VDTRAIVQLEGLGQLKNPMTSLNMSNYNLKPVNTSMFYGIIGISVIIILVLVYAQ
jgi:hypothetical protein